MYTEEQLGYMELSGKAIRFATPEVTELDSMEITLEPVQDLHGYDYPWAGGAGSNIWDEEWITGGYSTVSGVFINRESICSKNKIPVVPSTRYYITNARILWFEYDENEAFLRAGNNSAFIGQDGTGAEITVSDDCYYIHFETTTSYGSTYKNNIAVNYPYTVGNIYTPYENFCPITGYTGVNVYVSPTRNQKDGNTYSVTWESEAGTVYGGTLDVVSGKLAVTLASVDLGSLTWSATSGNNCYRAGIENHALTDTINCICSAYKLVNASQYSVSNMPDNTIKTHSTIAEYVYVKDSDFADAIEAKSGLSGVQLVYELAEPAEYQLDPVTIRTLIGINNIWTDTESTISAGFYYRKEHQPMAMNYDYCWTYPKVYIDKLEARIAALETAAADAKGVPETKTEDVKTEPETTPAETEQPEEEPVTRKGGK